MTTATATDRYRASTRSTTTRTPAFDKGAHLLIGVAQRALLQAPEAVPVCTNATRTKPELASHNHVSALGDFGWRLDGLEREVSCVTDAASARVLFGWTVGTTPVRSLSNVERTILNDVVRRLLSTTPSEPQLREAQSPFAQSSRVWTCQLRLQRADSPVGVTFHLRATADDPPVLGRACRRSLFSVVLPLRAAVPGVTCSLGTIRSLCPGTVLPLHRSQADLAVLLYAGRRYVAATQLGTAYGSRALKVLHLASNQR